MIQGYVNSPLCPAGTTSIARIGPAGVITEFPLPADSTPPPSEITVAGDGTVWFIAGDAIGRLRR